MALKLDHDANEERAEGAKKRYERSAVKQERTEAAENIESMWKAVFLLLRSTSGRVKSKRRE